MGVGRAPFLPGVKGIYREPIIWCRPDGGTVVNWLESGLDLITIWVPGSQAKEPLPGF